MAEAILMPRLSDTMTEGVIAEWHKKVGDTVKKGEMLADIETDKATMELESYKDGTLLHIGTDKGGKLQVNDLLAIIGRPGEDISGILKGQSPKNKEQARADNTTARGANKEQPKMEKEQQIKDKKPVESSDGKQETKTAEQPKPQSQAQPSLDISKMEEVVLMPRLSDTMTEGVIASWQKKVGDPVKKGEVLADIETDKATMELESYKNGTLLYVGAQEGEKIAVNELLCIIGEKGKVDIEKIVNAAKGGATKVQGTSDLATGQAGKGQGTELKQKEQEKPKEEKATENENTETSLQENGRV